MTAYKLIRSDRKTLSLEVTPTLEVVVRAPRRCTQAQIDRFVASHEDWIAKKLAVQEQRKNAPIRRQYTPEQEEKLRRMAQLYLPTRIAYYSEIMGVTPTGFRVTGAQKRFGSCSGKNSLCFSWRLMLYPAEAVDYVVVHELAHIRHHDHSKAFWALVEKTMPDYRTRQKMLKK
ncbi:MAG: M48 family metallopeptidase [Clostridia bacterium]|nr:M48 family metallopeptidase [Clostridia bacterium]